ncbi:MAG: M20 family metallopeptidase [Faecalimonas umbilicata]|uniref:M20 family metallopeptidase n=1 Tax=Faecalimonas umbilicata TaxID=1912855 RepID=UPI002A7654E3|nr:M20 family metallopeptidase [Faecalimonas umbilicata]MDY2762735.1 M20 family metallopeptidase [Faecalimonas umbilicata]
MIRDSLGEEKSNMYIERGKKSIALLKEILAIPSVNGADNEGAVAEFIANYLKEKHIDAFVQQIDETHANIIAKLEGKSSETVVWNGHLDTVPYGNTEEWNTDPSIPVEKNGRIYARGASDMKSGLAAMVYLLGEIGESGEKPEQTILFLGTCDEEKSGLGAEKILEEIDLSSGSLLLIGEPTGCKLGVAQKGCIWAQLNISGKTSHGAYPEEGYNAVEYGMKIVCMIKKWVTEYEHRLLGTATAQVTMIQGGIAPNMTPDFAEILLDIRIVPGISAEDVEKKIKKICREEVEETNGEVKFEVRIKNARRAIEITEEERWLKEFKAYFKQNGAETEEIGINYFTDASILTKKESEIPVLLFGPGEPRLAHKPNEFVELEKYEKYIEILGEIFSINYQK